MDKKRILFITIFSVATLLLGGLLYAVFFRKKPAPLPTAPVTEITPGAAFPEAGVGAPTAAVTPPGALPPAVTRPAETFVPAKPEEREARVVTSASKNPVTDANGNVQFYNQDDGKFYRLDADGKPEALSDEVFFSVDKVTWSPNQSMAIIEYPDGANIYYDFQTKRQVTLPKHWEEFSFSAGSEQIAAKSLALAPENRWLVTSDPDGGNIKFVEHLGENARKVKVDWSPNRQIVALSRTGQALGADRQEVLFVGLNKENFRSIIVEGQGLRSQWSPTGKQLLYSVHSARTDFKPELWIVEAEGENIGANRRPLAVNTWADKCAFGDDRFVYCAVPNSLETGAGLQPSIADNTPDQLVKIDLQSGLKTPLPMDNAHVINNLSVANSSQFLYFTDKRQDGIFKVSL